MPEGEEIPGDMKMPEGEEIPGDMKMPEGEEIPENKQSPEETMALVRCRDHADWHSFSSPKLQIPLQTRLLFFSPYSRDFAGMQQPCVAVQPTVS